jgi:long-chain acyl-CoA synthetase
MPTISECLHGCLAGQAELHPQKTVLYWGDDEINYQTLYDRVRTVAAGLRDRGIRPGAHVGLWMKNCPEFVVAYFAILACGGVVVPINNFLKPAEVGFIAENAELKAILSEASLI